MADQPVTKEKLINADIDVENLGKAVNEKGVVNPRYGNPYKSAPLVIEEMQTKADQLIEQAGSKINDIDDAINVALAAGAGAAGWTASLVVDGDKTQKQINSALTDGYAYVEFFGDTSVDATDAINMCLLYCRNYNKTAKSIPNKTYPVTRKVSVFTNCDFSQSTFSFPDTYNSVAVEIKPQVGDTEMLRKISIKLPNITCNKVGGVAPVVGSAGVKVEAVRDCSIHYGDIQGFEENLLLYSGSSSKYVAYVNFISDSGVVLGSKTNVHMLVESNGWVNECKFFGGHWGENSVDRAAYDAINLKSTKTISGGNNGPNGHCFFGVSMEGAFSRTIDYDFPTDLSVSYNSNNLFLNCRLEQANEIRLNRYALADTFIGCSGIAGVSWVDDVRPNIFGAQGIFNSEITTAALPGSANFRNAKNTHIFRTYNSANAIALAAGYSNRINGGLLSNGSYVAFHPTDDTRQHPIIKASFDGGIPNLSMGGGASAPVSRLTFYTDTQWRHNFDFCPDTNGGRNLGAGSQRYNTVFALKGNFSEGIGVFGTTPPTNKRSVVGKKAPTTVAEQNVVLESIVSALVAYGLVSDDRTV